MLFTSVKIILVWENINSPAKHTKPNILKTALAQQKYKSSKQYYFVLTCHKNYCNEASNTVWSVTSYPGVRSPEVCANFVMYLNFNIELQIAIQDLRQDLSISDIPSPFY